MYAPIPLTSSAEKAFARWRKVQQTRLNNKAIKYVTLRTVQNSSRSRLLTFTTATPDISSYSPLLRGSHRSPPEAQHSHLGREPPSRPGAPDQRPRPKTKGNLHRLAAHRRAHLVLALVHPSPVPPLPDWGSRACSPPQPKPARAPQTASRAPQSGPGSAPGGQRRASPARRRRSSSPNPSPIPSRDQDRCRPRMAAGSPRGARTCGRSRPGARRRASRATCPRRRRGGAACGRS